ncbi:hypothetical protein M9Y10_008324 [Tritrichomonas musculus]|uniref:MULE transposase domain-containing protein n=1 Tax=Tritrichomonas musculus TaxID=1915356 RepID=A0ABR2IZL5_9EUKA
MKKLCQRCKYLEEQLEKMEYDTYNKESKKLLEVSLEINSISPESYSLLSEKLNFPSKSKIDRLCNELTKNIPDLLRNIEKVPDIVNLWREKCNISKSQTIYACLSVDAIYFTPNVILDEKSIFDGLIFKQDEEILISKNVFKLFLEKPNEFKNFLSLNSNNIIKVAFVFQVQPYVDQFPTFIVYVKAACNGKANDEIIECLNMIKDYLKNRNITVLNFVFDGDNGYKNFHENFFLSYIKSIIKNNIISFSRTRLFKISSDFLHIIKRLRYRLFWADIFAGFTLSENFFNIDKLKKLFPKLADVIWSDEPITKMHETLALVLFSPQNLLFLLEHKHFTEAAYWMPISLCIFAFDGNKVGYDNRSFLLEISFWMLVFYYEQKNKSQKMELNETKRNGKKLQFYSQQLLIEFLNTIYTNIQLMHQLKKFKFSRASTDPLEHKFGCCRKSMNIL